MVSFLVFRYFLSTFMDVNGLVCVKQNVHIASNVHKASDKRCFPKPNYCSFYFSVFLRAFLVYFIFFWIRSSFNIPAIRKFPSRIDDFTIFCDCQLLLPLAEKLLLSHVLLNFLSSLRIFLSLLFLSFGYFYGFSVFS